MKTSVLRGIVVVSSVSLLGCATVTDHNDNIEAPYNAFKQGRFAEASAGFKEGTDSTLDGLCFKLDRGTVLHVSGDYEKSIREFENAKRFMGGFDDRATVSFRDIAEQGASFLVNEKTIPYKGEGFERVLLPSFQARNYFLQGDIEGAAVEARRCIFQQKLVRRLYEEELQAAKSEAQSQRTEVSNGAINENQFYSKLQGEVQIDQRYLSNPQSVYELAYVNFMVSVFLEAQDDVQNARVFAKRAYDILPQSQMLRRNFVHMERLAGGAGEAETLAAELGVEIPDPQSGSIVVFYDSGEAPMKVEKSILFPTGGFGFQKFALPFYEAVPNPAGAVELEIGDRVVRTEALTSVEQVAFKYFNDRMPLIITKAIIRVLAKIATQKTAEYAAKNNADGWVQILVGLGTSAVLSYTEQADLRAWRTLPQTMQGTRAHLPPGQYPVRLKLLSAGGGVLASKDLGTVTVKGGQIGAICVRSIGRDFWGSASPNLELSRGGPGRP